MMAGVLHCWTALLLALACCTSLSLASSSHTPPVNDTLQVNCKKILEISGDRRFAVSKSEILTIDQHCRVVLSPKHGDRLFVVFEEYDIDSKYRLTNCTLVAIQLESPTNTTLLGPHGYCGRDMPATWFDLQKLGAITFTRSDVHGLHTPRIQLLVTEVFDRSGDCPAHLFDCTTNDMCIDKSLVCNGASDCVGDQDEEDCLSDGCQEYCIATWVFASLVFVSIVIAASIVGNCVYKKKREGYKNIPGRNTESINTESG
ncbi:uncharacterized protein LOC131937408 [Physella acuta]|uniref:uncharacterized protein LOC131937408 n=1 Tax=Physella acuta TaxID=109671 RepID=UPI0027DCEB9F|nr:uncharacterized protein LOC131937408 [Physella acuta]